MDTVKHRKRSLQRKLAFAFAVIIAVIMLITLALHNRTVNVIRQTTYEKMNSQAEYYQQTFETEIERILALQLEFFNNRQLPFLASASSGLGVYEEREAVLSVQERIRTITEVSSLIKNGILYIPGNNYYISGSTIRRMNQQDKEEMENYLKNYDRALQSDGKNFYSIRTGETGNIIMDNPKFVFILFFSGRQIEDDLSVLNTSETGGVFIYNEAEDVMLASYSSKCTGKMIWERLEKDSLGEYQKVQQIRIDGENYLVLVGGTGEMGVFVQYVEEAPLMEYITLSWRYMTVFLIIMIGISVGFILYTRKIVHKPLNILVQAFEKVKKGNFNEHIYHQTNDEFSYLYHSFNDMEDRLEQLIDEVYVQKNLVQKAQLKQLQAQINPHFLYNSFFILSRRIKRQDYENADELARHLGNYFKYLAKDGADFIPLKLEVEHARSYAAIQQARFSDRIQVNFGNLPEGYEGLLVPRLIIQPLLENAFGHGLENKVSCGILEVNFKSGEGEIRICVQDNGDEAGDKDIQKMRESLEKQELDEITGIINIHRRLKIYFQGKTGLCIERSSLGGVAITIVIKTDIEIPVI